MNLKSMAILATLTVLSLASLSTLAADYVIDTKGSHASIGFKVSHLGYSWVTGRFNRFSGEFSYDADNPADAKVSVEIETGSIDSNHAERDKHLRSDDFLNVNKYPKALFVSTGYKELGDGKGELEGKLTLHGVTKPLSIEVNKVGEGKDPWGGYRAGFKGETSFAMADFGIRKNLGPAAREVTLYLNIEGIRK